MLTSGLALLPLLYVLGYSISAGWGTFAELTFRPRVLELGLNSAGLILLSVPACVALGVAAAWLVERSDLPGRRVWAVLLAAPLVVPAFVTSYGWVTVAPSFAGLGASVVVTSLSYYPLVYLPAVAALRRLDPTLEEVSASLGRSPATTFRTVVLPQLRLPILGGALLVSLHLLAEYGAFAMLRFDTFTTAILDQYRSTFSGPAAASLASVLVVSCLGLLMLENGMRGSARYARLGSGAPRPSRPAPLRRLTPVALLGVAGLLFLALGIPLLSIARWLAKAGVEAWTERHLLSALGQTAGLATLGAVAAVLVAVPLALLVVRFPSRTSRSLEAANYVTSSLPGIVVALALVTVTIRTIPALYQSVAVLVLAYVLLFLPRALVNVRAGLAQAPPGLEEVARSLGNSPLVAFWRVTARLAAPSALAGAALVFLGIVNELTATLLLGPNGTRTLATQFWSHARNIDYAQAAPYAFLMVLLSIPMAGLLFRASQVPVRRG